MEETEINKDFTEIGPNLAKTNKYDNDLSTNDQQYNTMRDNDLKILLVDESVVHSEINKLHKVKLKV